MCCPGSNLLISSLSYICPFLTFGGVLLSTLLLSPSTSTDPSPQLATWSLPCHEESHIHAKRIALGSNFGFYPVNSCAYLSTVSKVCSFENFIASAPILFKQQTNKRLLRKAGKGSSTILLLDLDSLFQHQYHKQHV